MLDDCGDSLSAVQWNKIKSAFAAHQSWVQAKPAVPLEQLPLEKLRGYLDDSYARTVRGLIADIAQTAFVPENVSIIPLGFAIECQAMA